MTKLLLVLLLAAPARAEIMSFGDPTADGIAVSPSTVTVTGTGPGCLIVGTTALYADCLNKRVGINKADPTAKLHVSSGTQVIDGSGAGFSVAGPATATYFYGDGSGLTGLSSAFTNGQTIAGKGATFETLSSTGTAPSLTATGAVFTASVTAPTIGGLLPGGLGVTSTLTAGSSVTVNAAQLGVGAGTTCDGTALLGTDYLLIGNRTCGTTNRSVLRWTGAGSNDTPANSGAASNGDRAVFYNDATGKIAFGVGNSYNIWYQSNGVAGSGHEWWGGATNVPTKQMVLDSSGRLGIGTASPSTKLHVAGDYYQSGVGTVISSISILSAGGLGVGAADAVSGSRAKQAGDYLILGHPTNSATNRSAIRFTGAGYNSTPSNSGAESNGDKFVYYNDTSGKVGSGLGGTYDLWLQANGAAGSKIAFWTGTGVAPAQNMTLDSSGNLGIGTASPNAKLDVTGAAMFGTGGTQSTFTATGFFQPYSRTTLQLSLLAPSAVGQYIDNSTLGALCRSTGTSAGNWALATAAGTGCF